MGAPAHPDQREHHGPCRATRHRRPRPDPHPADLNAFRHIAWIGNSRDSGDDELSARLCALAGWVPTIGHRADSLDLVVDLVNAGQGVSVLVADAVEAQRVRTLTLDLAPAQRRMWSLVRAGTQAWPATTAVTDYVRHHAQHPSSGRSDRPPTPSGDDETRSP